MTKMMGYDELPLQKKYGNQPTWGTFPAALGHVLPRSIKFRSKAEYNWAVWCQFRKEQKIIRDWQYEGNRIEFDDNARAPRSYLPDFWITGSAGQVHIEEVKGFLDGQTRSKCRKFFNERPEKIHLVLLDFTKKNANGRRLVERYCERIISMRECLKDVKKLLPFK